MMYSVKKIAKMLGVTTFTIRKWCKNGTIKAVKIPPDNDKSQWFIPEEELKRLQGMEIKDDE